MKKSIIESEDTKLALQIFETLARVFNDISKDNHKHLKSLGLTLPQFSIIESLGNLGSMKIGDLNNAMIYNGGNMTLVLDQLESKNITRRIDSPNDRRAIIIELTEEGHKLFNELYPDYTHRIKKIVQDLSKKEQAELKSCLEKLVKK